MDRLLSPPILGGMRCTFDSMALLGSSVGELGLKIVLTESLG